MMIILMMMMMMMKLNQIYINCIKLMDFQMILQKLYQNFGINKLIKMNLRILKN